MESTIEFLKEINNRKPFVVQFLDKIVGVTSRMYGFKYGEKEKYYTIHRGNEIHRYLEENDYITSYVILDDDVDMLICQKDNFVHTDGKIGLTKEDVEKAINILNR